MDSSSNYHANLQRLFNNLLETHYGSSKTIRLPVFGGHLELKMEFNNGMIDLIEAKTYMLGTVKNEDRYSIGYTCPVGMARTTLAVTESIAKDGMSAEAQLMHNIDTHNRIESHN